MLWLHFDAYSVKFILHVEDVNEESTFSCRKLALTFVKFLLADCLTWESDVPLCLHWVASQLSIEEIGL